jgi:hypothetical protein
MVGFRPRFPSLTASNSRVHPLKMGEKLKAVSQYLVNASEHTIYEEQSNHDVTRRGVRGMSNVSFSSRGSAIRALGQTVEMPGFSLDELP